MDSERWRKLKSMSHIMIRDRDLQRRIQALYKRGESHFLSLDDEKFVDNAYEATRKFLEMKKSLNTLLPRRFRRKALDKKQ